ncbi:type I-D CRISPR-associated endonuclease Cas1d [Thermaerobacter composti]|uniref:CRISPR-associated endonuclease Cas1 n=1 Tax=Thermaerobacter composti TaxID=554949 RepID=A0ABZ0QLC4_9FIRM|nr:type I-D CRISPR-associated endonuclease Cas1d [Thermaerobacter composti]WPD18300.1 type I-D CRISPR-associated endonuclease Cas1d [Thermaerobacter composti]
MATLYVTEPRSLVRKDGDTLIVDVPADRQRGTERRSVRVPLIKVDQVVIHGDSTVTGAALAALLEQRAEICFLSADGRFRGRLSPEFSKNSVVRLEQYRAHDAPERAFPLARSFVYGKLANMRTLLLRANRKREDDNVAAAAATLKELMDRVAALERDPSAAPPDPSAPQAGTVEGTLMGLEGAGTAAYFGAFGRLLAGGWSFERRTKRPPTDPVNALLSYGYVLLMHQVAAAVQLVGLDPYVGYLHGAEYGKPALAFDLMEEFRPIIVDSVVLTVLNNGMLQPDDFSEEFGAYRLTDKGRRIFLQKFEERLDTEVQHPIFRYKATYRRCLELQARLLAKALTGDIPQYRPFLVR